MRLEELHGDKGARQKRKRIGRGESSGWGRTAGKGNKGAQSRAGASKRKRFEGGQTPLGLRLPKRGFSHDAWREKTGIVNVAQLGRFEEGAKVDFAALYEAGLVTCNTERVKVLGNGEIERKLTVVADTFSASARKKIEAAGGTCETAQAEPEAKS
ncbi:50S ribosomal protein L15 [Candidatus Sumerlaeota bacterium]|nr:50S ribosomal protein L15 [Candidatus Sumerlaeota bacterium]